VTRVVCPISKPIQRWQATRKAGRCRPRALKMAGQLAEPHAPEQHSGADHRRHEAGAIEKVAAPPRTATASIPARLARAQAHATIRPTLKKLSIA
jgi:hypothetical protein